MSGAVQRVVVQVSRLVVAAGGREETQGIAGCFASGTGSTDTAQQRGRAVAEALMVGAGADEVGWSLAEGLSE